MYQRYFINVNKRPTIYELTTCTTLLRIISCNYSFQYGVIVNSIVCSSSSAVLIGYLYV